MSCRKHGDSVDGQYNRLAVSGTDVDGCCGIGRKMDKMARGRMQALLQNRRNRALSRTVIQNLRRRRYFVFYLNLCRRMTLRRADAFAILRKGKPFFIVVLDHFQQYFVGQRIARKAALGMVYLR